MIDVDSQSDGLGCSLWVRQVPNSGSAEPFVDFLMPLDTLVHAPIQRE